jgi:hypothetical protein
MASHLLLLSLFAAGVAAVFATLIRDEPSAQIRLGLLIAAGFVGVAVALGWLMYPFPL